jgi:hypothetical protein
VLNEAKRGAQEALFNAIRDQAENNMKAALRASEKAELLHQLAEAYRLTAGGSLSDVSPRSGGSAASAQKNGKPAREPREEASAG